jgi:hypothetical protein
MNPESTPNPSNQNPVPSAQPAGPPPPPVPAPPAAPVPAPVTPVASPAPVVGQPLGAAPQYPQVPPAGTSVKPQSNKGLWIALGGIGGFIVLLIIAFLVYAFFFSPPAQANRASAAFMAAATKGNTEELYKLGGASSADEKSFLSNASAQVQAPQYHMLESKYQNGTGFFLYNIPGAKSVFARTIVQKANGNWGVTSFVYGNSRLALVPVASSTAKDLPLPTTTPVPTAQTATACLKDEDVATITGGGKAYSNDTYTGDLRTYQVDTIFFKPDQTAYNYPDITAKFYSKFAAFYKANGDKQFTINLAGKVQDASPTSSGVKLAHDRVAKVEAELGALGVPTGRFNEKAPQQSSTYNDGSERNVDLTITMKLPCAGASPKQL